MFVWWKNAENFIGCSKKFEKCQEEVINVDFFGSNFKLLTENSDFNILW